MITERGEIWTQPVVHDFAAAIRFFRERAWDYRRRRRLLQLSAPAP
jgi:hypothetical protein